MYVEQIIGFGFLLDEKGHPLRDLPENHPVHQRLLDSITWGTPERVIREIESFVEIGYRRFMPRMLGVIWDTSRQLEMMQMFAKRVMPHWRMSRDTRGAAGELRRN